MVESTEYGSIAVVVPDERQGLLRNTNKKDAVTHAGNGGPANVPWKLGTALVALLVIITLVIRNYPPNEEIDADLKAENLEQILNAAEPLFYLDQLVNHHDPATTTYAQRYFEKKKYFGGPGSPIFVILGGEDELDGLLYPWIHEHLAQTYNAVTFALEHRFFGQSWPVPQHQVTNADLAALLTPNQALWDAVRFIQHKRAELKCSLDRRQVATYCPVMTVGGSYPGFLSALMRFVHADVVDISYAASAPLNLYSHHVDVDAYYEKVTIEAERASPGCSAAVRHVLEAIHSDLYAIPRDDFVADALAEPYGLCKGSIPHYIQDGPTLADELVFIVATHLAEYNMMYYPPGPTRDLVKACQIFQQGRQQAEEEQEPADQHHRHRHHHHRHRHDSSYTPAPAAILATFLAMGNDADNNVDEREACYDLAGKELPDGPNATITGSDWSGIGSGDASIFWEFISCQLLSPTGFSASSMFPPREWSFAWERQHCYDRFQWNISPNGLEDEFHFDERANVTHLLLTNGLVDGWSLSSILQSDAPGVTVVNMENGAHHSDLDHHGPTLNDTDDVKAAFEQIRSVIGSWLDEIRSGGDENDAA
jgi:Serine carboxypeptidase S28